MIVRTCSVLGCVRVQSMMRGLLNYWASGSQSEHESLCKGERGVKNQERPRGGEGGWGEG